MATPATERREGGTQWLALLICIAVCFAAAGLGSWVTTPAIPTWYADLQKPAWTPPDAVFGPVWTLLYLMMAIALWLVWRQHKVKSVRLAVGLFLVQLTLNSLWSWLFFGWHLLGWAAVEVSLLWVAIAATMLAFWRHSRVASLLLAPYLAWVSFATALNIAIWQLNR